MKRYGLIIVGILILVMVHTGSQAEAAEKMGFVDMRGIMIKSGPGQKASEDFKKIFEKEKAIIQEKENELKKLKDELEKQRPLLKEEAMKEKEAGYQKKVRDYQLLVKDSNDMLQAKDQDISAEFIPEIMKIINAIGEKENYSMIIDISSIPLAYYSKKSDLTEQVIEEFNKTFKPKE